MENRAHAWAAGLFTLALGAAVLIAAMWFSGDTYERARYIVESRYPVTGLNPQSTVRLRGVDVGRVEDIEFAPGNPKIVLIRITVRAGTPITRSTVGQLRPQGITGLSYIMLDDPGPGNEPIASGDQNARIPMKPAFTEELADAAKGLMVDARQLMDRLNGLLNDQSIAQVQRMLANLEAVTDRASKLAAALEPAAKATPAVLEQARRTLAEVQPMVTSVKDLTDQLAGRVDTLDRMARSAEQVGVAADSVSQAVVADALPRINVLADELVRTAGNLDRLLMQLRDQPSSVVFGAPRQPPGPGEAGFAAQRRER
ncbi:MAG: MlaD family protein [Rhodospirillaceae bacterium]